MRNYFLVPLLFLVGCAWGAEKAEKPEKPEKIDKKEIAQPVKNTATPHSEFNLTPEQAAKDLIDKGVTVGPFGQLWVFAEDQHIRVKILQKKVVDDNMVVAVSVEAITINVKEQAKPSAPPSEIGSSVPQTPGKKPATPAPAPPKGEEQSNPPLPSAIRLTGVQKLFYEEIAGQWHLVGVVSVSLKLTPK